MKQVVLIMTDSQRHDMVNCYRHTGLKTPHLDRLAASGMRFCRAYTTQPVCQPARAGIFTGMFPHASGSWTNSVALADNVHTVGERLADHGIHTAYIGKWHLDGGDYFGLGKCPRGWDPAYWYDMRNYLEELTPEERRLSRDAGRMKTHDFPAEFTFAHRCSDRAVNFLQSHAREDFFLSVSYDEPHGPCICPPEFAHMYDDYDFPKSRNVFDTLETKPGYQRVWAGKRLTEDKRSLRIRAPYYFGCNSFVDSEIGRVLEAVRRCAPNAYIIYTSDHGDFLGSHSLSGKGPAVYEEITHIPLLISGGGIEPGSTDASPVSHINLAPTIFDMFGLPASVMFQGNSLTPLLRRTAGRVNPFIFMEFGRYEIDHDGFGGFQPLRAVFDGCYKLSVNLLSTDELYDLQEDPDEMVNRIDDPSCADVRDRLHDAILNWMNDTRDPFRGYYWERRPWRKDARPATWDYTGMTRQSENDYEKRQLDYGTGLEMERAVRPK